MRTGDADDDKEEDEAYRLARSKTEDTHVERTYTDIYDAIDWKVIFGMEYDDVPDSAASKRRASAQDSQEDEDVNDNASHLSDLRRRSSSGLDVRRTVSDVNRASSRTWQDSASSTTVEPDNADEVDHRPRAASALERAHTREWQGGNGAVVDSHKGGRIRTASLLYTPGDRSWDAGQGQGKLAANDQAKMHTGSFQMGPSERSWNGGAMPSEGGSRPHADSGCDAPLDRSWEGPSLGDRNGQRPRGDSMHAAPTVRSSGGGAMPSQGGSRPHADSGFDAPLDRPWEGRSNTAVDSSDVRQVRAGGSPSTVMQAFPATSGRPSTASDVGKLASHSAVEARLWRESGAACGGISSEAARSPDLSFGSGPPSRRGSELWDGGAATAGQPGIGQSAASSSSTTVRRATAPQSSTGCSSLQKRSSGTQRGHLSPGRDTSSMSASAPGLPLSRDHPTAVPAVCSTTKRRATAPEGGPAGASATHRHSQDPTTTANAKGSARPVIAQAGAVPSMTQCSSVGVPPVSGSPSVPKGVSKQHEQNHFGAGRQSSASATHAACVSRCSAAAQTEPGLSHPATASASSSKGADAPRRKSSQYARSPLQSKRHQVLSGTPEDSVDLQDARGDSGVQWNSDEQGTFDLQCVREDLNGQHQPDFGLGLPQHASPGPSAVAEPLGGGGLPTLSENFPPQPLQRSSHVERQDASSFCLSSVSASSCDGGVEPQDARRSKSPPGSVLALQRQHPEAHDGQEASRVPQLHLRSGEAGTGQEEASTQTTPQATSTRDLRSSKVIATESCMAAGGSGNHSQECTSLSPMPQERKVDGAASAPAQSGCSVPAESARSAARSSCIGSSVSWRRVASPSPQPPSCSSCHRSARFPKSGASPVCPQGREELPGNVGPADHSDQEPSLHHSECSSARADYRLATNHQELLAKPIEQWDEEDVACWVSSFSAVRESITDAILAHAINGQVLLTLSEADIENLKIEKFGHRRILMIAARKLRKLHLSQRVGMSSVARLPSAPPASLLLSGSAWRSDLQENSTTAIAWNAPVLDDPPKVVGSPQVAVCRSSAASSSRARTTSLLPRSTTVKVATVEEPTLPGSPASSSYQVACSEAPTPGPAFLAREMLPGRMQMSSSQGHLSRQPASPIVEPLAVRQAPSAVALTTGMGSESSAPSSMRVIRPGMQPSLLTRTAPDQRGRPHHVSPRSGSGPLRQPARVVPAAAAKPMVSHGGLGNAPARQPRPTESRQRIIEPTETRQRVIEPAESRQQRVLESDKVGARDVRRQMVMESIPGSMPGFPASSSLASPR